MALLFAFLAGPPIAAELGGGWPTQLGWSPAVLAIPLVLIVDAGAKWLRHNGSATSGGAGGHLD